MNKSGESTLPCLTPVLTVKVVSAPVTALVYVVYE